MDFPHGVMVTIVSTTTTKDPLGNTTETTVAHEWGPCGIAPRYANESTDPRVPPLVVGRTVLGPPLPEGVTLDADDTLTIDGDSWQVDGLPEDYTGSGRNPFTGWEPGLSVPVKRAG